MVVGRGVGKQQTVLHAVVRVAGRDVERLGQLVVLHRGPGVGDTGGDEVLGAGVLADDVGLPADELGDLPGLELPPGHVVLRLRVVVGRPQIRPGGQPVGPVDEPPLAVQGLHVPVLLPQMVDEALEHALVVQEFVARLVVDLEADDGRVVGVPGDDLPDHPLGVEAERGVGEVDLLPGTPADALTGAPLTGDLRVLAGQPRRYGVRRGAEDDGDAALMGTVEDRLEPVEVEAAVLRLPGRPHRLADPDDGDMLSSQWTKTPSSWVRGCQLLVEERA